MTRGRSIRAAVTAALSATLVMGMVLTGAAPARAAYPGSNARIAFDANLDGSWQLYTMRANGTGLRQLTNFPDSQVFGLNADWSPDSSRIAFNYPGPDGDFEIWVVDADGSNLTPFTDDPGVDDLAPNWSPDGTKMAFARTGRFGANVITVMNADGTDMTPLTGDAYDSFIPLWTPDGQRIVFYSDKGGAIATVWIMNADGTGKLQLTKAAQDFGPVDVSPDGQRVLLLSNFGSSRPPSIWEMSIDGTGVTRLTKPPTGRRDSFARYSPNGSKIVLDSDRAFGLCYTREAIYVMNRDGSGIQQITTDMTAGGCPEDDNCLIPDWGRKP
jgi:Tol biopolymer transport system component